MNYELAQELKEAGFPKRGQGSYRTGLDGHDVYYPTLEELIEACGMEFGSITRTAPLAWTAFSSTDPDEPPINARGNSPTEAVARLWLALNKKSAA